MEEEVNRNGPSEGGERFAIFGKAEALGQGEPNGLVIAVGSSASRREETALMKTVGTSFFKDFSEFLGGQSKKNGVAATGLFPSEDFGRAGAKEGNEFGQGSGQLLGEGYLADGSGGKFRERGISLPKDVKGDLPVGRVKPMAVSLPIGGVTMYFNISGQSLPLVGRKGGAEEVWPGAVVPYPGVEEGELFSAKGGKGVTDEKLKPDSLKDRFGKNGAGLFLQDIFPNPFPISDGHGD